MLFLCNPYHQLSAIKYIVSFSHVCFCWVYIFETVCKITDGKITYLLTCAIDTSTKVRLGTYDRLTYIIHYSHTPFLKYFSDIWQCLRHPGPFHAFRIGCSSKNFNNWLMSNIYAEWLCLICVKEAWVPFWSDHILIWYNYILIYTLVTIFNCWLHL